MKSPDKKIGEFDFEEIVDMCAALVLAKILRGEFRSGIADAVMTATSWVQAKAERDRDVADS